jgi:hypothetical protein
MKNTTDNDAEEGLFINEAAPIKLWHEAENIPDEVRGKDSFNDQGFVLRAKADTGEDIHLWTFMYQQRGRESIIQADVNQMLLICGKFTDQDKEYMNPFANATTVNVGQDVADYFKPGAIKISEDADKVIWRCENLEYICTPPEWHVRGERGGVKVDIKWRQVNNAFWHLGTFETMKRPGMAGYVVHCRASGTVEVEGKVMRFSDQYGTHERITQQIYVPDRSGHMGGKGLHWMHGYSEGLDWFLMRSDVGKGLGTAMINVGDEQILLEDPSSCGVEENGNWIDPQSRVVTPFKWRVWIRTPRGNLETLVQSYARQYYTWVRRGATLIVNQHCADAQTDFTFPDGRKISEKQMVSIEHMRTFYRQLSTIQNRGGPEHLFQ